MGGEGSGLSRGTAMPDTTQSKKTAQLERIAAVNHWRGQCLDNFARVERAVIECSQRLSKTFDVALTIEESARNRTRRLHEAITAKWPKHADAKRAGDLLEKWMIREKQRNELVHGIFLISANGESGWDLINRLMTVKKGVVLE